MLARLCTDELNTYAFQQTEVVCLPWCFCCGLTLQSFCETSHVQKTKGQCDRRPTAVKANWAENRPFEELTIIMGKTTFI